MQVWGSIIIHAEGVQFSHSTKAVHSGKGCKRRHGVWRRAKPLFSSSRRGSFFASKPW